MHTVFSDIKQKIVDRAQDFKRTTRERTAERRKDASFKAYVYKRTARNAVGRRKRYVKHRIRRTKVRTTLRYRDWMAAHEQDVEYAIDWGRYVIIYGAVLNYSIHTLANLWFSAGLPVMDPQTLATIPAYGIAYYFLKPELTEFIQDIRR